MENFETRQPTCKHTYLAEELADRIPIAFLEVLLTRFEASIAYNREREIGFFGRIPFGDILSPDTYEAIRVCDDCRNAFLVRLALRYEKETADNGTCPSTLSLMHFALVKPPEEIQPVSLFKSIPEHMDRCEKCLFLVNHMRHQMRIAGLSDMDYYERTGPNQS